MSKRFLLSLAAIVLAGEAFASGMPPQVTVTSSPVGTQINTLPSSNPAGTSDTVAFPFQGVTGGVPVAVQSGSVVTGQASLTVGSSTGNVALGSAGPVVQVYNPGSAVVYVKLGNNAVTAASTDTPIAAGSYLILNTGGVATYIAAIAPTGTPTLTITTGTGTPLGWGGSGGGGSGAITTWAGGTLGAMANYGTSPGAVLVPGMNAFVTNAVTVTQGTAAGSGPWITTPWIAGAVNSATNGTYVNLLQGNAVNASGNPIFAQLTAGSAIVGNFRIDQTTPGTTNAVQANAGTNLNTSLLALETGGNLATLAGGVSASVYQENLKQINGVTTLTGAGAVGTGSQRVAVGQDTTTIAGSAPGTAGASSNNVMTVQGISGMIPVQVQGTTGVGGFDNDIATTPTVQNASYSASNAIGGLLTVSTFRTATQPSGIFNYVSIMSKGGSTVGLTVYAYDTNPNATTCTDKSAFSEAAADISKRVPGFPIVLTPATSQGATSSFASQPVIASAKNQDSALSGIPTIANGGSGYVGGDVGKTVTLSGGTYTTQATVTIASVGGGLVTGLTVANNGLYSVVPSNAISTTGGGTSGSGLTLNATWQATQNMYFCLVENGTVTPATTTDLIFKFGIALD